MWTQFFSRTGPPRAGATREVVMRSVMVNVGFWLLTSLAWFGCGESASSVQTVDSTGGVLTFPNGVVLDIPPGAVAEPVEIEVTNVDCANAEPILSSAVFQSHAKACLGGFSAKPDGLTFAKPVTATVPVRPLEPAEIPVQVELDFVNEGLRIVPTDLRYDRSKGVVEIRNLRHFSEVDLATLYQLVEDLCRTCEKYDTLVVPERPSGPILVSDLCAAYATDIWKDQQGGCCLLLQKERALCRPNCECCMEQLIDVEASGVDVTFGECQVLGSDVKVAYPACDDPTPQTHTATDLTPDCPKDMKLDIQMDPTNLQMYACETKNLREEVEVTLSGTSGGSRVFGPVPMYPRWTSEDERIANVNASDGLTTQKAGQVTLTASISRDPKMPTKELKVDISSNFDTFTLEPPSMTLDRDQTEGVHAMAASAPGRPPADWPPVDLSKVEWESDDPATAAISAAEGEHNTVRGVKGGDTAIMAKLEYSKDGEVCDTQEARLPVTVESGIAGNWVLTPTAQYEECRYAGGTWIDEDPFSSLEVLIDRPGGEGTDYIESTYVPDIGSTLTGSWDETSGDFQLATNTPTLRECEYIFYEYEVCGDAVNCELISCENTTTIVGSTSEAVDTMTAQADWHYSVTFSFGDLIPPVQTTGECRGSASVVGVPK